MWVNVRTVLTDYFGETLKKPDFSKPKIEGEWQTKDFTLMDAAIEALNATFKGEEVAFDEKFKRFKLALKISEPNEEGVVDFDPEEVTTVINLVGKSYPPIVAGRVAVLLGKSLK